MALASRGHYDHWALNVEHPRLLVALVIMLDQFRRNMYRDTPEMYASDARCLALVKRGLRVGVRARLRPIERVFLCLALTHSEALEDQHLCMEEWGRAMEDLAPDDPLNAFHEIFHRHVAVIMRFGRFPHRNKVLHRANTPAEEEFLENNLFRFDLPLVRQPDGSLAFAGTIRKRTVKLLDHEYQTLLPGAGEAHGAFEFAYAGPDAVFTRTQEQLKEQGYIRIGDSVPDFTATTSMGPIRFHEFIGDGWCVLFSHPADFTPVCTTELGATANLQQEWKKRGTKVIGLSVDGAEDHARWIADINETQHAQVNFPIIADKDRRVSMLFGMLDATTFRHGRERRRDHGGAQRLHHLAGEAGRADPLLPGLCRPQFQRDPARARCPAAVGEVPRGHAGELAARRGHGGAALHLRRGGRADVRGPGRRAQGALLPALRARSLAPDLLRDAGGVRSFRASRAPASPPVLPASTA